MAKHGRTTRAPPKNQLLAPYTPREAMGLAKGCLLQFDETVEVMIRLGVDTLQGRPEHPRLHLSTAPADRRVAVFAEGAKATG